MQLRPYQSQAIERLRGEIRSGHRSVLLVLPTGGGKTVLALHMVRGHIANGGRVLFLTHRTELIKQAARTFIGGGMSDLRIIQAGKSVGSRDAPITIASIPTLATERWAPNLPDASLVILDETQHVRSESWQRIAEHYRDSIRIGLTATPERADGKALGDIYTQIVVVRTVRELTDDGYIVPCSVFAPSEYRQQLAADPADAYLEHGDGKRGIIFCATVQHARSVAESLSSRGIPAACVDGKISASERARHLARFRAGELRVVTNVAVLTEGFDDPGIEVCVLARACDHVGLYLQIVGRVLRPSPGKHDATLIDLRGAVHRHGLPDDDRTYSLDGEAIRQSDALPPLKQCKQCGYCGRTWRACPECGYTQRDAELPEVRRERLRQVFANDSIDQRQAYFEKLTRHARECGYAPGWVAHRFRAKYGIWPIGVKEAACAQSNQR
jgi:DNA repair protein RadD